VKPSLYLSHSSTSDPALLKAVAEAASQAGFDVIRPREFPAAGSDLSSAVQSMIYASSAFAALLDRPSFNVIFEVGFAMGSGKDVLLIAGPGAEVPSDLAGVRYLQLSGDRIRDLVPLSRALGELQILSTPVPAMKLSPIDELRTCLREPQYFAALRPDRFEQLVASVFQALGFEVQVTPRTRDGGVDLIVIEPTLRDTFVVEAKKYGVQTKVSARHVYDLLRGAQVCGANSGILITASGFTRSAIALAESSSPRLSLLSLEDFLGASDKDQLLKLVARTPNPAAPADRKAPLSGR
jgi:hypothetical protein